MEGWRGWREVRRTDRYAEAGREGQRRGRGLNRPAWDVNLSPLRARPEARVPSYYFCTWNSHGNPTESHWNVWFQQSGDKSLFGCWGAWCVCMCACVRVRFLRFHASTFVCMRMLMCASGWEILSGVFLFSFLQPLWFQLGVRFGALSLNREET